MLADQVVKPTPRAYVNICLGFSQHMNSNKFIDNKLEKLIEKRASLVKNKTIVVGCGITSSHLGDSRNLREFLYANEIVNDLRDKGINVLFLLFDDNYDPLSPNQLKIAVKKDEELISQFEQYCGTPIKLIPDPYGLHNNYSEHYQKEILNRFHNLNIFPNVIDSWSSYESGVYDSAKEIVFTKMEEIHTFLKEEFPKYTIEKIFWPLCEKCHKIDGTTINKIIKDDIAYTCAHCKKQKTISWKEVHGKFSWKIDIAIRWNVFKCDFEPFSKAYLDPNVGSYIIAKKLSEKFFGGYFPEVIEYGQVFIEKELSYTLLPSLPTELFQRLFLSQRKTEIHITRQKIVQEAKQHMLSKNMSFYDYVKTKLQYDNLEFLNTGKSVSEITEIMRTGNEFMKNILKKEIHACLPTIETLNALNIVDLKQIYNLLRWVTEYKTANPNADFSAFIDHLENFFNINTILKAKLLPNLRKLISQEQSSSINRILYFMTDQFLYATILLVSDYLNSIDPKPTDKNFVPRHVFPTQKEELG